MRRKSSTVASLLVLPALLGGLATGLPSGAQAASRVAVSSSPSPATAQLPERTFAFTVSTGSSVQGQLSRADRAQAEKHHVPARVTAMTPAIAVSGRVSALGVSWKGAQPGGLIQWRFRAEGAAASNRWTELPVADHGPDAGTAEARTARRMSDPVLTTEPGTVEFRQLGGPGSVSGLRASALEPTDPRFAVSADHAQNAEGVAPAEPTGPSIRPRSAWGADESLRKGEPSYGAVKGAVVHHTVNANTYAAEDVPALIRAIYAYHVIKNGWNDIGYNFLIDRFGRIWEGRYGGANLAVVGAHSPGVNSWSTGVATIGDFTSSSTTVPAAVRTAYRSLLSWKAQLHQIDPRWTVNLGGKTQRSISGHRDNVATECPGAALYAAIPSLIAATEKVTPRTPASTVRRDADNGGGNDVLATDGAGRFVMASAKDDGVLTATTTIPRLPAGAVDLVRVAGDWNGDGAVDLIARVVASAELVLYAGDGTGGFNAPVRIGTGWRGIRLLVNAGDITGDGHADLLATTTANADLRVYPGNGRGGFLTPKTIGWKWNGIRSIVGVGDWDRDGHADILGITTSGRAITYPSNGRGALRTGPALAGTWANATVSGAGDVTGDGLVDLVVKGADGQVRIAAGSSTVSAVRWIGQTPETVALWRGLSLLEG